MNSTRSLALLAAALLLPARALAQDAAPTLQEDPRAARFRDVERGLFVGFEVGYLSLFDTPVAEPATYPSAGTSGGSAGGMLVGVNAGIEIGSRIAVSLFALGGNEKASSSYGAFSVFAGGADVRIAFLALEDRNGDQRLLAYVHGRGGYALTTPEGLFGTNDIFVAGGPGIEYFTRLRHFSVGIAADYVRFLDVGADGFTVYPTVRYTF
ncbi:MAG TPA: adventurous gliding motility protein CglE [Anaeromyxobacteraceae bacterium]|nr:adventurous gliding motility protein CglE [Anaeromyxobacteraceae bacterium]